MSYGFSILQRECKEEFNFNSFTDLYSDLGYVTDRETSERVTVVDDLGECSFKEKKLVAEQIQKKKAVLLKLYLKDSTELLCRLKWNQSILIEEYIFDALPDRR